jgi:cytochrome P450
MVNFISNTLLSLAREPELVAAIRRDRSLVPVAVEESLRRDSPSMYLTRVCADRARFDGTELAEGEKVLVGLASANRDETAYPDATVFRLDRDDQPGHLAFGWGSHLCIGAPIVRTAGATLLDALLDHVSALELEPGTTPVPYLSPQGNGLDELWLRLSG